jgi:hypothetical protein
VFVEGARLTRGLINYVSTDRLAGMNRLRRLWRNVTRLDRRRWYFPVQMFVYRVCTPWKGFTKLQRARWYMRRLDEAAREKRK